MHLYQESKELISLATRCLKLRVCIISSCIINCAQMKARSWDITMLENAWLLPMMINRINKNMNRRIPNIGLKNSICKSDSIKHNIFGILADQKSIQSPMITYLNDIYISTQLKSMHQIKNWFSVHKIVRPTCLWISLHKLLKLLQI